MAGSERAGPASARADLFVGRPWVLTPGSSSSAEALARAIELARLCGADPVLRTPREHDRAVAVVSHLPQLVASALAATLTGLAETDVSLAGQGLRDMTRIADSDPRLWGQIGSLNAPELQLALDLFLEEVSGVRDALWGRPGGGSRSEPATIAETTRREQTVGEAIEALVGKGNAGRRRLPAKHGVPAPDVATITVTVADRPGELARILTALAQGEVNLEDLAVDHAPGAAAGLAYLSVAREAADRALSVLGRGGWTARYA
jgi:prephenate dehydrogenase